MPLVILAQHSDEKLKLHRKIGRVGSFTILLTRILWLDSRATDERKTGEMMAQR